MQDLAQYKKPLIAGGVLLVLVLLYLNRQAIGEFFGMETKDDAPKPNKKGASGSNTTTSNNTTTPSKGIDGNKLLRRGGTNQKQEVIELQILLNMYHLSRVNITPPTLVVDGAFGQKTEEMLKLHTGLTQITLTQATAKLKV